MSVATEIARIKTARNSIRTKLNNFGLVELTADIDDCATALSGVLNQGSISATVQEGETYTIPAGYHTGSGTVSGIAGGGNYTLLEKTVIPTKALLAISSDDGYYGLSSVTIEAIPSNYLDVSSVNVTPGEVLANKLYVASDGTLTPGEMINRGTVSTTLNATNTSYTIPIGYHDGKGAVSIVLEEKIATPNNTALDITPTTGKVLSKVTINPIPSTYKDTSDATATAALILNTRTAYGSAGKLTGTMPNNGAIALTLNALSDMSVSIPAGYTSGGSVALTSDLETALSEI